MKKSKAKVVHSREELTDKAIQTIGKDAILQFKRRSEELGATQLTLDISDYGFGSVPMCLYSFKGDRDKKCKREVVGALNRHKETWFDGESEFSDYTRRFMEIYV